VNRYRLLFRAALVVGVAWSAYPTVAGAVTSDHTDGSASSAPARGASAPPTSTTTRIAQPAVTAPPSVPSTPALPEPEPATASTLALPALPEATEPAPAPIAEPAAAPPPAPAAVAATAVGVACDGSGSPLLDALNRDRRASGVGDVCSNAQLNGFAQTWANWMAQHGTLTHQDLHSTIALTTFSAMAENILVGPGALSIDQMEAAWMGSPPHREHNLDGSYTAVGVGIAFSSDGRVWAVIDFAR
jgi:uncharacterized protein YkwD